MKYIITVAFAILLFVIGCILNVYPLICLGSIFGMLMLIVLAMETKYEKRYERR